jgi:arsenite/tail-anchored protein-transporting ATPase
LREAERTSGELRELGVANQRLVINGSFSRLAPTTPLPGHAAARGHRPSQRQSLHRSLPSFIVPLRPVNILGSRPALSIAGSEPLGSLTAAEIDWQPPEMESLEDLVTDIEQQGRGVIMTMGKGGVGKTTVAAAIAVDAGQARSFGAPQHHRSRRPCGRTLAGQVVG